MRPDSLQIDLWRVSWSMTFSFFSTSYLSRHENCMETQTIGRAFGAGVKDRNLMESIAVDEFLAGV
jgi:hypothetical protein